ncbi:hypothetical protein [Flavobacterium sp. 22076]|uniref:hypothetical protein n=1 Tax=unclassified Flavobacterium TaxID=196869 RepID=UPI003F839B70
MKIQITTLFLVLLIITSCKKKQDEKILLSELQNEKIYKNLDSFPKNLELVCRVDLSKNDLTTIPEVIFKLPNLKELNLSVNNLTALNHLEELQNLQILNIGMNNFKYNFKAF